MNTKLIAVLLWSLGCGWGCAEDSGGETVRETGYQRCVLDDADCPGALACLSRDGATECVPVEAAGCEADPCSCFGVAACGEAVCTSFGRELICDAEDSAPFLDANFTRGDLTLAFMQVSVCLGGPDALYEFFEVVDDERTALSPVDQQQIQCVAAAADCAEVLRCMGYEADLCDEMSEAACMGDTYRRCERLGDGRLLWRTTDCAADADGNTRCDPAEGCLAPLDACEAQGSRCEGTIALDCVGSAVGRRFECARSGRTCVEDDSSIRCAVAPTGCAPCDGDVAQFCDGDIILSRSNCAATGLSCSPDGADGGGRCVAEQPVCDEGESRCDGPVAGICRRGLWFEFDCGRAGAQCALVGVGGEQQAVCE